MRQRSSGSPTNGRTSFRKKKESEMGGSVRNEENLVEAPRNAIEVLAKRVLLISSVPGLTQLGNRTHPGTSDRLITLFRTLP